MCQCQSYTQQVHHPIKSECGDAFSAVAVAAAADTENDIGTAVYRSIILGIAPISSCRSASTLITASPSAVRSPANNAF